MPRPLPAGERGVQQDWPSYRPLSVRITASRLGRLLLPLALLLAPASAWAAPATEADMSLYTRLAALNVCIARAAGVEFDKAVAIAGETIAQVIQGQHQGRISQVSDKPLPVDELRKGSINSAVLGAVELCPKEVPDDVRKKVDEVLKTNAEKGSTPAPKPAPAAQPAPTTKP